MNEAKKKKARSFVELQSNLILNLKATNSTVYFVHSLSKEEKFIFRFLIVAMAKTTNNNNNSNNGDNDEDDCRRKKRYRC